MDETILNLISLYSNHNILTDKWENGAKGTIVDLQGDGCFRFVDYVWDDDNHIREKYLNDDEKLACPIVACGLVGWWLHKRKDAGIKEIFESYYELRMREYEKEHESDVDAWERDLKNEFVCRKHIPAEKKLIKQSEALNPYITQDDIKKIHSITENYLRFARTKRKELYPPQYAPNRVIEDTFLAAFRMGGPAYECIEWMRTEYNLPNMGPHCFKDGKTKKEQLSGIWKEHHEITIPEYVAEEFEDFNDGVLTYSNGGLMDEINENLKNCQTYEDRVRYIISLLQPFKEFASAFYSRAQIEERKRSIIEHYKWIEHFKSIPENATDEKNGKPINPKDQIEACVKTIEEYQQDIAYWKDVEQRFYWFAQHGLTGEFTPEENHDMCKFLGGWWRLMIYFSDHLAAVCLTYGIKLMDVQEKCEVYINWEFLDFHYVDYKFISSIEHARKLLKEIEHQDMPNELEANILNILRNHGKEIDPSLKDSKQIYDFEELSLYTQADITECSKNMQAKDWIYCFIDHDGCPAFWHELKDKGRIALRGYLEEHPLGSQPQNTVVQPVNKGDNKAEVKHSTPGRPPKDTNPDIHYTLLYKPFKEETDADDKPIPLNEQERDIRILMLDKALRDKYKWFDDSTPDYALKNLLSGQDVKCNIVWKTGLSNNAKTQFINKLVASGTCTLMTGCSGIGDVMTSQFNINAAYRKAKPKDMIAIDEMIQILNPKYMSRQDSFDVTSVSEKRSLSDAAELEVNRDNLGIQNRPGGKIL